MGTTDTAIDLRGIIPATVLPMTPDAQIDEPELRRYIRWIADQGVRAVAVNVDTGEGPHLWHEERLRVLRIYREELSGRRIPIVAGLGASFTAQAVKYAREYREAGAECLLVFPITAYLGKPLSPDVPYRYHKAIAEESGLPLILFTLQPALGGTDFADETLQRLIEIPEVVAIKEALFDAKRFREIVNVARGASRRITVLTGNDNFIWESYLLGAEGALLGACAVTTRTHVAVYQAAMRGDWVTAREKGDRIQKLVDAVFAPPVRDYRARCKEVLVMQGILKHAHMRPPLMPIGADDRQRLKQALEEAGEL
ncbi:MAG TPA: dihydrodipicolinate synthase family protein [Candidatus Methylomirabilis sp.]|nr:dihydrodipicolinate synthase family protein [Candidatus Methylomirabilis sp.]